MDKQMDALKMLQDAMEQLQKLQKEKEDRKERMRIRNNERYKNDEEYKERMKNYSKQQYLKWTARA